MALCCRNGGSIYPGRVALCRRTDGSAEHGIFNGASTAVLGEDFDNEVIMEEEKTVDVSALGNSENNENEQEQDNNPLDTLNEGKRQIMTR